MPTSAIDSLVFRNMFGDREVLSLSPQPLNPR